MHHVYNRFARGEAVFADPEEAIGFVELLREVKRRDCSSTSLAAARGRSDRQRKA
jgi:hypothetical protein